MTEPIPVRFTITETTAFTLDVDPAETPAPVRRALADLQRADGDWNWLAERTQQELRAWLRDAAADREYRDADVVESDVFVQQLGEHIASGPGAYIDA